MVWRLVTDVIHQLAEPVGPGLPGVKASGGEMALDAGDGDVSGCSQCLEHLLKFSFGHVKAESGRRAVVDLEIAAYPNLDLSLRMRFRQFEDGGHLDIVVKVHDASAKNDFLDSRTVLVWAVEMHLAGADAEPAGDLILHIGNHLGIASQLVYELADTGCIVGLIGVCNLCVGVKMAESGK